MEGLLGSGKCRAGAPDVGGLWILSSWLCICCFISPSPSEAAPHSSHCASSLYSTQLKAVRVPVSAAAAGQAASEELSPLQSRDLRAVPGEQQRAQAVGGQRCKKEKSWGHAGGKQSLVFPRV